MTQKPDLVSVVAQDGKFHLCEPDEDPQDVGEKRKFRDEEAAIIAARRINRRRKGLPPDPEAFNR